MWPTTRMICLLTVCVGGSWLSGAARAQALPRYQLTDLGYLTSTRNEVYVRGLNDLGQVVGICEISNVNHPFVWTAQDGMRELAGTVGASRGAALDINNAGQIVGTVRVGSDYRPIHWDIADVNAPVDLGGLYSPADEGSAWGINASGQIVGSCGPSYSHAFFRDTNDTMLDLGQLDGGSRDDSRAYAVNDFGHAVGVSDLSGNNQHAFYWTQTGGLHDLGAFPNTSTETSVAYDVNNSDLIVGYSNRQGGTYRATWWTSNSVEPTDLGDLPGGNDNSIAYAVNDAGLIVGRGQVSGSFHAVIWDGSLLIHDLNGLLDSSGYNWVLKEAWDINAAGQIVAWGEDPTGEQRAVLLTPVPEPATFLLAGLGLLWLVLFGVMRRRDLGPRCRSTRFLPG